MPETSPGQVAFAAFWPAYDAIEGPPKGPITPWEKLSPAAQAAWEAAAQAAIAAWWRQHEALLCGDKEDADA